MSKSDNFFVKITAVILGLFALFSAIVSVTGYSGYSKLFFNITYMPKKIFLICAVAVGSLAVLLVMWTLFKLIDKLQDKGQRITAIILLVAYSLGLLFVIYNFQTLPVADSFNVHDYAVGMANGEVDFIDGETLYFGRYANNNLIVIVLYYLYSFANILGISDYVMVAGFVNVLMMSSSQVMMYFVVKKIGNRKTAIKYLAVSLLFPPMMLSVTWIYTVAYSLPMISGILLCGVNLIKAERKKSIIINSAVIGALTVLGYFMRPVVVIFSIAGVICLAFWCIKDKKRILKSLLAVAVCGTVAVGSFAGLKALDSHYYTGSERSFPLVHWVAMGLSGNGGFDAELVEENQRLETTEEISENSIKYIKKTMEEYTLPTFLKHLYFKHKYNWGDGTLAYDSRINTLTKPAFLSKFFIGSKADIMYLYCQMMWTSLHLLCLMFVISVLRKRQSKYTALLSLSMVGAYFFYMIWEAKPIYASPFMPLIIALATFGGVYGQGVLQRKGEKIRKGTNGTFVAVVALSMVLMIIGYGFFVGDVNKVQDISISTRSSQGAYVNKIIENNKRIVQTFTTGEKFNDIRFLVKVEAKKKNTRYIIKLFNQNKECIAKKVVGKNFWNKNSGVKLVNGQKKLANYQVRDLHMHLDKPYEPQDNEKFYLRIKGKGNKDTLKFMCVQGDYCDPYPGEFYRNRTEVKNKDLQFVVGNLYRRGIFSPPIYIALCIVILAFEVFLALWTIKTTKNKKE